MPVSSEVRAGQVSCAHHLNEVRVRADDAVQARLSLGFGERAALSSVAVMGDGSSEVSQVWLQP